MRSLKLRHYEKVRKFEKIAHCFYSVASKQVGYIFFQIFVAFSEKLNFNYELLYFQVFLEVNPKLVGPLLIEIFDLQPQQQ